MFINGQCRYLMLLPYLPICFHTLMHPHWFGIFWLLHWSPMHAGTTPKPSSTGIRVWVKLTFADEALLGDGLLAYITTHDLLERLQLEGVCVDALQLFGLWEEEEGREIRRESVERLPAGPRPIATHLGFSYDILVYGCCILGVRSQALMASVNWFYLCLCYICIYFFMRHIFQKSFRTSWIHFYWWSTFSRVKYWFILRIDKYYSTTVRDLSNFFCKCFNIFSHFK